MNLPIKDSMVYINNNQLYYLLYKLTPENLLYPKNEYIHKSYLCVFYNPNNQHYLGQLDKEEIIELLDTCNMTSLLSNTFDDLKNKYPLLEKDEYLEILNISKEQLNID